MKYEKLSKNIIEAVGGSNNIVTLQHCMTRLRFTLKDESKANDQKIEAIDGVLSLIKKGGQYQVVIGTHVHDVYLDVCQIANIKEDYDYIVIDCPPSLSMLTINAMTTADSVLVPIQCEYYALEGLSQLIHTVELVRDRLNPQLTIEGVVFTMYDARTNLSLQVVENVKDNLDQTIYKTIIPRNIRLAEAPSYGMPINKYDPKSAGADSYMRLADEVMEKE